MELLFNIACFSCVLANLASGIPPRFVATTMATTATAPVVVKEPVASHSLIFRPKRGNNYGQLLGLAGEILKNVAKAKPTSPPKKTWSQQSGQQVDNDSGRRIPTASWDHDPNDFGSNQMGGGYGNQPMMGSRPGGFGSRPGGFGRRPGGYGSRPGGFGSRPGSGGQIYNRPPGGQNYNQGFGQAFNQGMGSQGFGNQGYGQGMGNQGFGPSFNQGYGNQGYGQGMGSQGYGQGMGNQGGFGQGFNQGMGSQGSHGFGNQGYAGMNSFGGSSNINRPMGGGQPPMGSPSFNQGGMMGGGYQAPLGQSLPTNENQDEFGAIDHLPGEEYNPGPEQMGQSMSMGLEPALAEPDVREYEMDLS